MRTWCTMCSTGAHAHAEGVGVCARAKALHERQRMSRGRAPRSSYLSPERASRVRGHSLTPWRRTTQRVDRVGKKGASRRHRSAAEETPDSACRTLFVRRDTGHRVVVSRQSRSHVSSPPHLPVILSFLSSGAAEAIKFFIVVVIVYIARSAVISTRQAR